MLGNSWDSKKRRLGRGQEFKVPEEVSAADATLLIRRGLAAFATGSVQAVKDMRKAEIIAELARREVVFSSRARRGQLADMLTRARNSQAELT